MVTAELLEARLTTSPEGPARPLTDSVKFTLVPPTTEGDATEKLDILGRFTVKVVLWEVLLKVAVIVTTVVELTGCESRSKVAVDFPAGTNSVAGMVTAGRNGVSRRAGRAGEIHGQEEACATGYGAGRHGHAPDRRGSNGNRRGLNRTVVSRGKRGHGGCRYPSGCYRE